MFSNIRLQGTDGVRGLVLPSNHETVRSLSPQEAFAEKGVITEQFAELYSYCVTRCMIEWGEMEQGGEVVVGWDPRDEKGVLTGAAVRGVLKAGAVALAAGVSPTPAVPLFMLHKRASLGLVVTASHNPAAENGIKIFLPRTALKPLPEEDRLMSEAILNTDFGLLADMEESATMEDVSAQATALFKDHCCQSRNSWIEEPAALDNLTIIVDPANGAYTGVAREVFERLGVGEVIEVNPSCEGPVNQGSGVTQFEGVGRIGPDFIGGGGEDFSGNAAVLALFDAGRRKRNEIKEGNTSVSAAVFDADGDRFYRLDYHAAEDMAAVFTGDDIAVLQAEYLMEKHRGEQGSGLFITTVESDINVLSHAKELGMETALTGVGDKWILREIAGRHLPGGASEEPGSALSYQRRLEGGQLGGAEQVAFFLGTEDSGHNVTAGWLEDFEGGTSPVFIGNGLKSAINSYAAGAWLRTRLSQKEYWGRILEPFTRGFKKTYYVYHSDRERFKRGSSSWNSLESQLRQGITSFLGGRCRVNRRKFSEEEDMLYLSVRDESGLRAGVFARNSGTEDKTSINLRGKVEDGEDISNVGLQGIALLSAEIKSGTTPMGGAALRMLEMLFRSGPMQQGKLKREFVNIDVDRLFHEMLNRERSVYRRGEEFHLTPLGHEICKRRFGWPGTFDVGGVT